MKKFEVTWTTKIWYTRDIEANSRREAVEISEDMGDAGVEIDFPDYKVSTMKARMVSNEI